MSTVPAPLDTLTLIPPRARSDSLPRDRRRWADLAALAKPRLSALVLFTVAIGFVLAAGANADWLRLVHTLAGTALVAVGASILNQAVERDTDARMTRTADRPVAAGRMTPAEAMALGAVASVAGMVYLSLAVNWLTAMLGLLTLASYVLVYTPLKRRTQFNTLVGALAGALPPVMGWAAARGSVGAEAGALFLILFLWQFPHFWAIAWMYRADYARAGMQMAPGQDREGGRYTGRLMVRHCLALVAVSLGPYLVGLAGPTFLVGAMVLGLVFTGFALRFLLAPSDDKARHVLWASLVYLPVLLTLLMVDRM